jgi:hypothetical protein
MTVLYQSTGPSHWGEYADGLKPDFYISYHIDRSEMPQGPSGTTFS